MKNPGRQWSDLTFTIGIAGETELTSRCQRASVFCIAEKMKPRVLIADSAASWNKDSATTAMTKRKPTRSPLAEGVSPARHEWQDQSWIGQ